MQKGTLSNNKCLIECLMNCLCMKTDTQGILLQQLFVSLLLQLCWDKIKPTLVTKLGQGSFGQVYEGWYHSAPMAVKIMNNDRCTGNVFPI